MKQDCPSSETCSLEQFTSLRSFCRIFLSPGSRPSGKKHKGRAAIRGYYPLATRPSSAKRPVVFRPFLTKGLALSGYKIEGKLHEIFKMSRSKLNNSNHIKIINNIKDRAAALSRCPLEKVMPPLRPPPADEPLTKTAQSCHKNPLITRLLLIMGRRRNFVFDDHISQH